MMLKPGDLVSAPGRELFGGRRLLPTRMRREPRRLMIKERSNVLYYDDSLNKDELLLVLARTGEWCLVLSHRTGVGWLHIEELVCAQPG